MRAKTKHAGIVVSVIGATWFSGIAIAQETTYSADSLMAAFEKRLLVSRKGTQITFADVLVEINESTLTFKSAGNDKVVCRLGSPIDDGNSEISVGTPLTVVGKVRGRGMLGNVTLDQCSLAPKSAISEAPSPDPPDETSEQPPEQVLAPIAEIPKAPPAAAAPPKRVAAEKPLQIEKPVSQVGLNAPVDRSSVDLNNVDRSDVERSNVGKTIDVTIPESPGPEKTGAVRLFYGLLAMAAGLGGFSVVAKLRSRLRGPSVSLKTEFKRRAALEALLAVEKKKR